MAGARSGDGAAGEASADAAPSGSALSVAALQIDVRRGDVEANLAAVRAGLVEAQQRGIRLVVLPEMWPTSFVDPLEEDAVPRSAEAVAELGRLSAELDLVVCGSAFAAAADPARPYNRLHVFDRGAELLRYDKVHLFSPTAEHETFSAGASPPPVASSSLGRVAGIVCYDLRFAEVSSVGLAGGAELLLVPAQWPEARASHWRALVLGRAVENQCFVVAANRIGVERVGRRGLELAFPGNSIVVDPHGRVLAEGRGEPGLVAGAVELDAVRRMRVRVPVAKDRREALYERWRRGGPGGGRRG